MLDRNEWSLNVLIRHNEFRLVAISDETKEVLIARIENEQLSEVQSSLQSNGIADVEIKICPLQNSISADKAILNQNDRSIELIHANSRLEFILSEEEWKALMNLMFGIEEMHLTFDAFQAG